MGAVILGETPDCIRSVCRCSNPVAGHTRSEIYFFAEPVNFWRGVKNLFLMKWSYFPGFRNFGNMV